MGRGPSSKLLYREPRGQKPEHHRQWGQPCTLETGPPAPQVSWPEGLSRPLWPRGRRTVTPTCRGAGAWWPWKVYTAHGGDGGQARMGARPGRLPKQPWEESCRTESIPLGEAWESAAPHLPSPQENLGEASAGSRQRPPPSYM